MILKKPYAFLIKHFKLIHAILTILYVYLAFFVSSMLNFYNSFISDSTGKINAIKYISNIPYFIIILSIIICLVLFILMNYKKKPKFLYIILIIIYIAVFAVIWMASSGLNTIYNNLLETKTVLLYRDFLRIILIFQYGSIVLTTIRAIGFDIKKFNFSEDINELNIDVTDDEEVELVMGVNSHKLTQKMNRRIRELKYYYAENKIFVIVIIAVIILLGLSTITIDKKVINKVYQQGEIFESDNFKMEIIDSYITNTSYDGQTLRENGTFVVVKLYIEPKKTQSNLNTANMILKINNNKYSITKKYYNYLKDLGIGYKDQEIKSNKTYLLVYNIPTEEINNSMYISYTGSAKEMKINLSPKNLDKTESTKEFTIPTGLDFSDSILSGSTYQITSYEIQNKFTYNYTYSIDGTEYTGKKYITSPNNTILYLELTSSFNISTTNFDFLNDYAKIKYIQNETEYTNKILNDKTPGNYEKGIYLEVDKNLENADKIWIEFHIRNMTYKYILK